MIKAATFPDAHFPALEFLRKALSLARLFVKRKVDNVFLRRRLRRQSQGSGSTRTEAGFCGLAECDIAFINLDHRVDRLHHINSQLNSIGISDARRVPAIKDSPGSLGCARSHLRAYLSRDLFDERLLMVCEDDIAFVSDRHRIDQVVHQFKCDERLDVLLLSYVAYNGVRISELLSVTSDAQTTACYIAKPRALPRLIACAECSIDLLSRGLPDKQAAIDVVWKKLQHELWFAISSDIHAVQIESYSDIQGKVCSYFPGFQD
jgi:hypothetical protein